MWALNNSTPYATERGWIRDINGAEHWLVAVKCTYDIQADSQLQLAANQLPVNIGPVIDPVSQQIIYETDLGAAKQYTDIILNGHAWAPQSNETTTLIAGFKIGTLVRLAKIYGNRTSDAPDSIAPFTKIALHYQNMSAGSCVNDCFYNPQGRHQNSPLLPNIEFMIEQDEDIGFGVVPAHWRMRSSLVGTYDDNWQSNRYPLYPEDFDPQFWQVAPKSQQVPKLKGGEQVTLAHLTPPDFYPQPVFSFYLPRLTLIIDTHFTDGEMIQHRPTIHSLILEPDYPRISVVWHSALPCHGKVNSLKFSRIWQKKRVNSHVCKPVHIFAEWEALCQ